MRVGILIIVIITFLIGCKSNSEPKDLLPPSKMENVLTDILLAESFAESYLTIDTTRKLKEFYDQELNKVIAVHKISQKQLRSSMEYYKSRPEILKVILDSVNNKAIREKDKVYKEVIEKRHLQKSK